MSLPLSHQLFRAIVNDDPVMLSMALGDPGNPRPLKRPAWQRQLALFLARRGKWTRTLFWTMHIRPALCRWPSLAHGAVLHAGPQILSRLVEAGAWVDVADNNGQTALHLAARLGKLAHFMILATAPGALEREDREGRTARDLLAELHPALFHAWQQDWVRAMDTESPRGANPHPSRGSPIQSSHEQDPKVDPPAREPGFPLADKTLSPSAMPLPG
jgi:hypothetical protein